MKGEGVEGDRRQDVFTRAPHPMKGEGAEGGQTQAVFTLSPGRWDDGYLFHQNLGWGDVRE